MEYKRSLKTKTESKAPMLAFALLSVILCFSYCYRDIIWTQEHGIEFWNCLFDGQIMNFYQRCIDDCVVPAVYNMSLYIVFAIWNFPCWLIGRIMNTDPMRSGLTIYYGKIMVLVAYFYSIKIMKRIFEAITAKEDAKELSIDSRTMFYATSLFGLVYAIFVGQYDIISVVFMLLGIEALIKGKRTKFLVFFAIAVSMKYFALFLIIPLILLSEKRILHIVKELAISVSLDLVLKLIFRSDLVNGATEYGAAYTASHLLGGIGGYGATLPTGTGTISVFVCAYVFICIYCYLRKCDSTKSLIDNVIYVSFVVWGSLFVIYGCCAYWLVIWAPFIALLVLNNKKHLSINIILEMVMTLSMYIFKLYTEDWVVGNEKPIRGDNHIILNSLIVDDLGWHLPATPNLGQLIISFNDNSLPIINFMSSFVVVSFVALSIINFPSESVQKRIPGIDERNVNSHYLIMVRNGVGIASALLPTVLYLYYIVGANL